MRILWLSNAPWAKTGYGTQTKDTVPQLGALGHAVAVCAFYGLQGGVLDWRGVPVYPALFHRYGQDAVAPHAAEFRADCMISLMDAWVCNPDLWPHVPWAPWFPIDHAPMPAAVAAKVARALYPITMAPFGKRMCDAIGLEAGYVPHAIDTATFAPMERQAARSLTGLPADRYIVGMVAANKGNPSRKAFPQQLEGFALFKRQVCPDALLYLHTSDGTREAESVNLPELCDHLDLALGRDVLFANPYMLRMGADERLMAALYSSFDALINASLGEGFGIPILEAQSCGTPVVVGDWTAMGDLAFCGSIAIDQAEASPVYTALASYQWSVRPAAVAEALAQLYRHPPERGPLRQAALAFDAATVRETHWRPVLAEVERRLEARRGRAVARNGAGVLV